MTELQAQISQAWNSSGGQWLQSVLTEEITDAELRLLRLMDSEPDKLTGKTAIRIAARRKALKDFADRVAAELNK